MSDTLVTVIAILLAAIMMFVFPLLSVSERSDDISQLSVQTDIFSCSIKNTNKTLSQTIRGVFYSISTGDTYSIAAQHSGVCTANGSK